MRHLEDWKSERENERLYESKMDGVEEEKISYAWSISEFGDDEPHKLHSIDLAILKVIFI